MPGRIRKQALKIGTRPEGFAGALPYDAQAGIPAGTPFSDASYVEQAPMVAGGGRRGPIDPPNPIK